MVSSSMRERGPLPKIKIPEDLDSISHAARKFVIATFAVGYVADLVKKIEPRSYDFISTHIENHIGNFPPSVAAGYIFMNLSKNLLYKAFKDETAQKREPIVAIGSILMVVGLNMFTESSVNPNPEMFGDVVSGAMGGAIGATLNLLPEFTNTRKLKK